MYTMWYKRPTDWFFKKIKNVDNDLILKDVQLEDGRILKDVHLRIVVLKDKTRIELPLDSIVKFCRKRHEKMLENFERAMAEQANRQKQAEQNS